MVNIFTRGKWCGFCVAPLLFQCGLASAAPAVVTNEQAPPPITLPLEGKVTPASFKTPPSEQEISQDYPKLANMMQLPGAVKLTCDVERDAAVDHCVVESEIPTGLGFGAAALHIASGFHMNPATIDGAPIKSKHTFPIRFARPETSTGIAAPQDQPPVPDAKMALARRMIDRENYRASVTQTYEAALERLNQELEWSGRPSETQAAMDAYRQGVQDAFMVLAERKARKVAMQMSEADLTATVDFLESSAGQAWLTLNASADSGEGPDFQLRVSEAARKRYCAQVRCEARVGASPANPTPQ